MKKTLLIAAAALAAGVISSQAQVYSQNIVGYANRPLVGGYNLLVTPFSIGSSNGANEVFPTLPDGSTILTWNGSGFNTYFYDTTVGISPNNWYQADQITPSVQPTLPVGKAFYISPGALITNTFAGTVVPASGATNTIPLVGGYNLVGSGIPVGGAVTNSVFNLPLTDGSTVLQWTGSGYTTYFYDSTVGISANNWYLADQITPGPVPSFNVADGFFFSPGSLGNWNQTLP